MENVKLENGKSVKLKELTIDERDELLDSCKFTTGKDGSIGGMEAPHSTMTKFIRIGVEGDTSDKFLKTLTFADKTNIFTAMQEDMLGGEGKPSK
tara:strand:+ start:11848 stop:12132 length:285 start_codon:yes stop_codon:yes gene_type:complete